PLQLVGTVGRPKGARAAEVIGDPLHLGAARQSPTRSWGVAFTRAPQRAAKAPRLVVVDGFSRRSAEELEPFDLDEVGDLGRIGGHPQVGIFGAAVPGAAKAQRGVSSDLDEALRGGARVDRGLRRLVGRAYTTWGWALHDPTTTRLLA